MKVGSIRGFGALFLCAGVYLLAYTAPAAAIDSYLTDEAPIARHDKRTSGVKFSGSAAGRLGRLFYAGRTEQTRSEQSVISYRELPVCTKPEVSLLEVHKHNPLTDAFDVLYYEAADAAQAAKAGRYDKRAVAYQAALVNDPRTGDTDLWQTFARFIKIDCLPTRFHFIVVGGRRYMEFRKGELAWSGGAAANLASAGGAQHE